MVCFWGPVIPPHKVFGSLGYIPDSAISDHEIKPFEPHFSHQICNAPKSIG